MIISIIDLNSDINFKDIEIDSDKTISDELKRLSIEINSERAFKIVNYRNGSELPLSKTFVSVL